jgi:uncharacterized membrane protein
VGHSLNAAGARRAFLWDSTGMKDLNGVKGPNGQSATTLGWTLSAAYGINSSGQVVGYGSHPLQDATKNNTFLWQRDVDGNVSVTAVNLRIAQFETRGLNDNGLVAELSNITSITMTEHRLPACRPLFGTRASSQSLASFPPIARPS